MNPAPSGKDKERVVGVTVMIISTTGLVETMETSLLPIHLDLVSMSLYLGMHHMVAGTNFGYALIHP